MCTGEWMGRERYYQCYRNVTVFRVAELSRRGIVEVTGVLLTKQKFALLSLRNIATKSYRSYNNHE